MADYVVRALAWYARLLLPAGQRESFAGDIAEIFSTIASRSGRSANLWLVSQLLRSAAPLVTLRWRELRARGPLASMFAFVAGWLFLIGAVLLHQLANHSPMYPGHIAWGVASVASLYSPMDTVPVLMLAGAIIAWVDPRKGLLVASLFALSLASVGYAVSLYPASAMYGFHQWHEAVRLAAPPLILLAAALLCNGRPARDYRAS